MTLSRVRGHIACASFSAAILFAGSAMAQEPQADQPAVSSEYGDIVVLARKRAESIQDVPLAITAVDAATIERSNITSIAQITQMTPNVSIQNIATSRTVASPYIRGIGQFGQEPSNDPPIAVSIDGVYLAQVAGSLLDVFDAQQIEVLRGPQGALQGRNSPGGAINVTSRRPSFDFGARADVSYGNLDRVNVKAAVEGPLVQDVVAVKLAGFYQRDDGYVRNLTTGSRQGDQDTFAARLGLLVTPADSNLSIYLTADYTRDRSGQPGFRYLGGDALPTTGNPVIDGANAVPLTCTLGGFCTATPRRTTIQDYDASNRTNVYGFASNINYDLGAVSFVSVTGYRKVEDSQEVDVDGVPAPLIHAAPLATTTRQFSQEFRISSNNAGRASAGELDWVLGLYYLRSTFHLYNNRILFGESAVGTRDQVLNSYAVFGQASYHLTDTLSLSIGGRQSWDKKKLTALPVGAPAEGTFRKSFDNLSLEAGAEYKITRDLLAYFRFAQGYRAGGFNGDAASLEAIAPYNPEKNDSYELGFKTSWLDNRLTINLSLFHSDYKNLQRQIFVQSPNGLLSQTSNQGSARIRGLELESRFQPIENLTLTAMVGYLDAKYKDYPYDETDFPHAPKLTTAFGFDYTVPLGDNSLLLSGDISTKSKENVADASFFYGINKSMALVNGYITYKVGDQYSIGLFGKNLTNRYYLNQAVYAGGFTRAAVEAEPRTYGVRMTASF